MSTSIVSRRWAVTVLLACFLGGPVVAQAPDDFSGRLSWVPISGAQRAAVGGNGAVSGSLARSALSISGTFEGLPSPAVSASLREGVATGARGPVIAELSVTRNNHGTISGEVRLSRSQLASLRAGRLYVQLHAENGVEPDNAVLWGWLLAEETSR